MPDTDLTAALLRAYMSAGPRLEVSVLAVARVALERAAEVAKKQAAEYIASLKTASEDDRPRIHFVVGALNSVADDIVALIPPEKETTNA